MIFIPYSDESNVINMIRRFRNEDYALIRMTYTMIDKNNLPFEYIWMDAGWHGDTMPSPDEFVGDWSNHTGDWRVSPHTHPNGLTDVSDGQLGVVSCHDDLFFFLYFSKSSNFCTSPVI